MSFYHKAESNFLVTTLDEVLNYSRKGSLWYLFFGLACCAIEMMQAGGPRTDLDRFGVVFRATPRQADFIFIAGTPTIKMADRIKRLWDQMPYPKYAISMGSCSNTGGLFQRGYSVLHGIDKIIPIDVYVPGCPPRPEALTEAILILREKVQKEKFLKKEESKLIEEA